MNKTFHKFRLTIILCLITLLLPGASSVFAQEDNLLENPGFENPYIDRGGTPARQVAQGWNPWHVTATINMASWQNQQPEYDETAPNDLRIRSGDNAQQFFSFFEAHTGGVFQRVTGITPGTELRFSVYAWVWSSTFSDQDESELDGDVVVQVGIDPTGGTDGTSSSVIWSPPAEQYDTYRQYAVIATASSNAVTVFVRSTVNVAVQNNYIYLDDAVLATTTGSSQPVATNTDVPQATNTTVPQATDTSAPQPTNTSQPVDTEVSVIDPTPTAEGVENTDVPPATSTPVPSETDIPPATSTPIPTNTQAPQSTETPVPTNTPDEDVDPTPTAEGDVTDVPEITPDIVVTEDTSEQPGNEEFPNTLVHIVRSGETVGELATLYGTTITAISEANDLNASNLINVDQRLVIPVRLAAPATITPVPTSTGQPEQDNQQPENNAGGEGGVTTYVVRRGDTLYRIAINNNTTVTALARLNGIVNTNIIRVGQVLQVPSAGGTPTPDQQSQPEQQTYVVQFGDTLFRIALRFGVNAQQLASVNGISNPNLVFWGQTLIIP